MITTLGYILNYIKEKFQPSILQFGSIETFNYNKFNKMVLNYRRILLHLYLLGVFQMIGLLMYSLSS